MDFQILASGTDSQKLSFLSDLKHSLIGHDEEKLAMLSLVPIIMDLLESDSTSQDIKYTISLIIRSYCHGNTRVVEELLKFSLVDRLISLLVKAVEQQETTAAVQYIHSLMALLSRCQDETPDVSLQHPELLPVLIYLISTTSMVQVYQLIPYLGSSALAVDGLAPLNDRILMKIKLHDFRGTTFTTLNSTARSSKLQFLESALFALSHVMSDSFECKQAWGFSDTPTSKSSFPLELIDFLVGLLRAERPQLRLACCAVLTKYQYQCLRFKKLRQVREKVVSSILPCLVFLLNELPNDPRVPLYIALVCRDDERSAVLASDAGVLKQLVGYAKTMHIEPSKLDMFSNILLAIAGISMHNDRFRKLVIENDIINSLTRFLDLSDGEDKKAKNVGEDDVFVEDDQKWSKAAVNRLKIAACHVLRALSRSVSLLRTLTIPTSVVDVMFDILKAPDLPENTGVKAAVMASMCNIVLEFSPLQTAVLERGILDIALQYTHSPYPPLRCDSLWALKHSVYEASKEVKERILESITPEYLLELCNDDEPEIQEQALGLLRNLTCRSFEIVDRLLLLDEDHNLLSILKSKLDRESVTSNEIVVAATFVLVHIASGKDSHRDAIIKNKSLLYAVKNLLSVYPFSSPAIWCVINLTWNDTENERDRWEQRIAELNAVGFAEALRSKQAERDISDRAKAALLRLQMNNEPIDGR